MKFIKNMKSEVNKIIEYWQYLYSIQDSYGGTDVDVSTFFIQILGNIQLTAVASTDQGRTSVLKIINHSNSQSKASFARFI